ncbi:MAG: hypothetical protein ACTH5D_05185 [Halomonas sp.]|uniref:hypothetical protein n=1 Tax=Halomonas sp. TaxID=1486246 RepID=UPI003F8DF5B0
MFTVNTARSYKYPVALTVYDENGKENTGKFKATFKVKPQDELRDMPADTLLLDEVLKGVEDIVLTDDEGNELKGDDLLKAAKNDPAISTALITAYQESISKKNRGRI